MATRILNGIEYPVPGIDTAIKILRPDIHKIVNEELDALMFLAYLIENFFQKTKMNLKILEKD